MKYAYRYKEQLISSGGYDVSGEYAPSRYGPMVNLILLTYEVIAETPQGFWINTSGFKLSDFPDWKPDRRWISKDGLSAYARLTKEEALKSYIARKKKQIKICESNIRIAKLGKDAAELNLKNYETNT